MVGPILLAALRARDQFDSTEPLAWPLLIGFSLCCSPQWWCGSVRGQGGEGSAGREEIPRSRTRTAQASQRKRPRVVPRTSVRTSISTRGWSAMRPNAFGTTGPAPGMGHRCLTPHLSRRSPNTSCSNATTRMPRDDRQWVFIHGLWMLPSSWDRWVALFEENGSVALTPGWPDPRPPRRPTPTPRPRPARTSRCPGSQVRSRSRRRTSGRCRGRLRRTRAGRPERPGRAGSGSRPNLGAARRARRPPGALRAG